MPLVSRVLLALGLSLVATAAEAQVAWEVPEGAGCPSEADVRAKAESLLAGSVGDGQPDAPMRAAVRALGDGTFELSLESPTGLRHIRGESCAVLADAAALIYAMTIDPAVAARLATDEPAADAAPELARGVDLAAQLEGPRPARGDGARRARGPLVASMVSRASVAREADQRARATRDTDHDAEPAAAEIELESDDAIGGPIWALGVGAVGDVGLLPAATIGPSAHAGLELDLLRIELRAMLAPAREARLENHETARGEVSFVGGEARACAVALRSAVELAPCAGITAGAIQAESRGVSSPGSSAAPFVAVAAGGTAALPIADWLALRADLAAVVPITRPEFVIDGIEGVVHRPSVIGARLAVSAEVQLR